MSWKRIFRRLHFVGAPFLRQTWVLPVTSLPHLEHECGQGVERPPHVRRRPAREDAYPAAQTEHASLSRSAAIPISLHSAATDAPAATRFFAQATTRSRSDGEYRLEFG